MDYSVDAVVVGAGIVGLAVARALAESGRETVLIERASMIGTEASSRNSEVIHAGIYYPSGSLKARLCVRGKTLLYDYARRYHVAHRNCGKLVLAVSEDELPRLAQIRTLAEAAGVLDLQTFDEQQVAQLEPEARAIAGLHSPSTGIVDSHQLMLALQGDFEAAGGIIAFNSDVRGGRVSPSNGHVLEVSGQEDASIGCELLVNAAGLHATALWNRLEKPADNRFAPQQYYAIGHYYTYSGKAPFTLPVYPVPEQGGLGVHATPDLAGQIRFGPDVRWVEDLDYSFDDSQRDRFVDAIRRYFPGLDAARLQPGYTGIRSKLAGPGEQSDFRIYGHDESGLQGYVGLHGIESPGLTASLAIAEYVTETLI